jgi:hypothetical protein
VQTLLPRKPQDTGSSGGDQLSFVEIVLFLTIEAGLFVGVAMAARKKNKPATRVVGLGLAVASLAACIGAVVSRYSG